MVLSAPPPDDPQGEGEAGWVERVARLLRLGRRGTLILVDRATDARLEELVRALLPEHPELEVYTEPQDLADAPAGSAHVLAPRPEHAGWLNMQRPLFAERALKVVLWCDAETSAALARKAPDFFDWIGHRVECPPGVARFAVQGLRCALRCRAPGIVWRDDSIPDTSAGMAFTILCGGLHSAFSAALPGRRLEGISPYDDDFNSAVRAARHAWIYFPHVGHVVLLERVLRAIQSARRRGRVILLHPRVATPGWWPVHGHAHPLREARNSMAGAGFPSPGRLAALCGLESAALDLALQLLCEGADIETIIAAVRDAWDPGASLACLAEQYGIVDLTVFTLGKDVRPPVWRAFSADPRVRRLRSAGFPRTLGPSSVASQDKRALDEARLLLALPTKCYPPLVCEDLSEGLARKLLWEIEVIVGTHHPMHALLLGVLALTLASQGRYEEAERHLRRALKTQRNRLPPTHRDILWTTAHLASVLAAQGRHAEARPLAAWVLQQLGRYGPNRQTALALAHLAAIRHALGEPGAADDARRALDMLAPDDPARDELSASLRHIIGGD